MVSVLSSFPVWPLGTYFIIPCAECDDPDGDADQYRGIRAKWDTTQIIVHYWALAAHVIAIAAMVVLVLVALTALHRRTTWFLR